MPTHLSEDIATVFARDPAALGLRQVGEGDREVVRGGLVRACHRPERAADPAAEVGGRLQR